MLTVYLAMLSSEEDRERFTLLYEAHEKRLYAVALKILENPTRAEDAAQQAWLQVLRNWERVNALDWDAAARYLAVAAKNLGYHYAEGITQSKDSFYGQHEPENMPAESRLKERWEAWRRGNVMTSEMEAAALFVISSIRGCRAASIMSFVDMKKTVEVARDALKILIRQDAEK